MKNLPKKILDNIRLKERLKLQREYIEKNNLSGETPLELHNFTTPNGDKIPKDKNNFIDFNNIEL